jgi:hypothetical protein
MPTQLHLDDVRRAWEARDPELVRLIEALAEQPDEKPETPLREGALTFDKFLREIQSPAFHRKSRDEQAHYRVETLKALEAPNAEVPLPDRLRAYEIILQLWQDNGPFARTCLLRVIAGVRLTYGPWRALKRIFKEAEAKGDTEILGALSARFDAALASSDFRVSRGTLLYLCRRAWRFLRRLAVQLPVGYPDAAVDFLAPYPDNVRWLGTWVANHVFYHETREYNRNRFTLRTRPASLLKHRAFADLWRRTPRPLFSLLERAKSEQVRAFATEALQNDFRAMLREVEPEWVARLVNVGSRTIDAFVVWVLNNVPRFEQAAFRTLGLHEAVLRLFDSPAPEARVYAAEYARTHARDLPVPELVRLADNSHEAVRKLATDLLLARDPRKDVGLDAWGALLETRYGHELAAAVLRKSFGARELTPEWFKDRLFSPSPQAFQFAKALLPQVHPAEKLGPTFFTDLIDRIRDTNDQAGRRVADFALAELARFDLNALPADFLKRLLLHPLTQRQAIAWINEGRLDAETVGLDFLQVLAFHPAWEADAWVAALKASDFTWARGLEFNEELADQVLAWLSDVRRFAPADLGFDWLMRLVSRAEPRYHEFAVDVMVRGFLPADFAPREAVSPPAAPMAAAPVNLGGASFLFTGKLATMSRKEAEDKVRQAGGVVFSAVSNKLYYLVIGDEGSPLYGHGKKGTKQTKAEELNAGGANIKIISETAFLQMLAGGPRTVSEDATLAGCERLWQLATAPGPADAPVAQFARKYLRLHHPDLGLAATARPVDPGAEIPASFLTFERVRPLFAESRKPLRELALDFARWEFARWAPSVEAIIRLSEVPYADVRNFVAQALLADDAPEHRRYRVDPAVLTPAAVYGFCESAEESTRQLGMTLIKRSPRLQVPEELFRLTESPDRVVRAFVIRALWSLYRERGITQGWKPTLPPQATVGPTAKKAAAAAAENRGTGAPPKPDHPPANPPTLAAFLRRILFEVPPGRLDRKQEEETEGAAARLRPLPARKAKLASVEVLRDLALEDAAFARGVLPLLQEFLRSRGESERAACLVALTRIRKAHPDLENLPSP